METIVTWIESHSVTVGLVSAALVGFGGLLGKFLLKRSAKLEVYGPAGLCYVEDHKDPKTGRESRLAVFILNPAIKNHSDRNFQIDRFYLGYDCLRFDRKFRQKLFATSFPARPRKQMGNGQKILSVFFTKYADGLDEHLSVSAEVAPKSIAAAYVMFISNTWGSWIPREINEHVTVKLFITTVGEKTLTAKTRLKVSRDIKILEDFCPGISSQIRDQSLWNAELKR